MSKVIAALRRQRILLNRFDYIPMGVEGSDKTTAIDGFEESKITYNI